MRKYQAVGVALFAAAAVMSGSGIASASAGWDYVGASDFSNRDVDSHLWFTDYVHSTGGSFRACVGHTSEKYTYALWEHDSSNSRKVASKSSKGGCLVFNGIDDYVDGSNNKAELMLSTTNPEGGDGVAYYD